MRLKICSRIQEIEGKIAFIIGESTTISNISTLVVYLKCETSKLESPQFVFLDLSTLLNPGYFTELFRELRI